MFPAKLLMFATLLCELAHSLDSCGKGHRLKDGVCTECPEGHFQPVENRSKHCRVCTRCEEDTGSDVIENCTRETNTKCGCRGQFQPKDRTDSSTCHCIPGYGLNGRDCLKCEDGYFSTTENSACKKWRECRSAGVKVNGTQTSDVICNEEPNGGTEQTSPNSTPKADLPLASPVTSHPPHEGNQSHTTITTTTAPPSENTVTPTTNAKPSNRSSYIGVFITFTIVGLVMLIALTFKLSASPHPEMDCEEQKDPSLCLPVMETGDRSRSSNKWSPDEL